MIKQFKGMIAALAFAPLLAACGSEIAPPVAKSIQQTADPTTARLFPTTIRRAGVARSNVDIAQEFMELAFELENGAKLPRFTRYEGPISVSLVGEITGTASHDLDALLARLRAEAGIKIRRTTDNTQSNIQVQIVPTDQMKKVAPGAACFVIPNATSWSEFRRSRYRVDHDWTQITHRTQASIFIPADAPPQEIRDCLHEEIAQALGPLNDLYRLTDSVFNDDNFQITLTSYDMLILRAYYAPGLQNGMSRAQVSARILGILNSLNPQGRTVPQRPAPKTTKAFKTAIEGALGQSSRNSGRTQAATRAVEIAQSYGSDDVRLGFAHFARARIASVRTPNRAEGDYRKAYQIFQNLGPTTASHRAVIAVQLASLSLQRGQVAQAEALIQSALPVARETENAALLFNLLALQAQAYRLSGQSKLALTTRAEATEWGLYAFGSRQKIQNRLARIARMQPGTRAG